MEKKGNAFDREASLKLKGIAIMMLLLHHCFMEPSFYTGYSVSFFPFTEQTVNTLAQTCKVCVAIFAFISGYGLYLDYDRRHSMTTASRWCARRYVRTFSGHWFVWLLAGLATQIIDGKIGRTYLEDGILCGTVYGIIDFTGLAKLFSTPTMSRTWWYMSAIAVYILVLPLIYRHRKNLWLLMIGHVAIYRVIFGQGGDIYPGNNSIYAFMLPFMMGCAFARNDWINRWRQVAAGKPWMRVYKLLVEAWLVVFGYGLYRKIPRHSLWEFHFALYPLLIILFSAEFVIYIPGLEKILAFWGKHSMNVFLTHSILRIYLKDLNYAAGHFALDILALLAISIAASMLIEGLKKLVRYQRFVGWLEARI